MKFAQKFLILLALFGTLGGVARAKPAQPETVLDYFLLLPKESYFASPLSSSERKKWLYNKSGSVKPVIDIENDYILFPGDGAQGTLQFAVFRYKGRALIVVRDSFEDGSLNFLRYENGRWTDVTSAMMPAIYNVRYDYHVPRWGTTIKVTAGRRYYKDVGIAPNRGQKIYDLVWIEGRFKVKR